MAPSRLNRLSSSQDDDVRRRQATLTKIIEARQFEKQDVLANELKKLGFEQASQATVSRDLRELGIVKDTESGFYTLSEQTRLLRQRERLKRAILEDVEGIYPAVAVFAVRTTPGHARGTAVIVEKSYPDVVFGTIAGEDTAIIIARDEKSAGRIAEEMADVLHSGDGQQ